MTRIKICSRFFESTLRKMVLQKAKVEITSQLATYKDVPYLTFKIWNRAY